MDIYNVWVIQGIIQWCLKYEIIYIMRHTKIREYIFVVKFCIKKIQYCGNRRAIHISTFIIYNRPYLVASSFQPEVFCVLKWWGHFIYSLTHIEAKNWELLLINRYQFCLILWIHCYKFALLAFKKFRREIMKPIFIHCHHILTHKFVWSVLNIT